MADDRKRDADDGRKAEEDGAPGRRGPGGRDRTGARPDEPGDSAGRAEAASGDDLRDSVERSGATAWLDGGTSEERKEPGRG